MPSARDVLAGGLAVIDGIERANHRRKHSEHPEETGGVIRGVECAELSGWPN